MCVRACVCVCGGGGGGGVSKPGMLQGQRIKSRVGLMRVSDRKGKSGIC